MENIDNLVADMHVCLRAREAAQHRQSEARLQGLKFEEQYQRDHVRDINLRLRRLRSELIKELQHDL